MNEITGKTILGSGKYLELSELYFTDSSGAKRKWEAANRVNTAGAVMLFAVVEQAQSVLLVRQFRAPAGKFVWEFPAGLIDPGETPEICAVRELYEETGYTGCVLRVFPAAFNSPGMSGETITLVKMSIDAGKPENIQPQNHPESSECGLSCSPVPLAELSVFLRQAILDGDGVDAKLLTFATLV